MMQIVISDADGTLVKHSKLIDPKAFDRMLSALAARQIPFAVASGRSYSDLRRLFGAFADRILYLPLDGSLAIAGGVRLCGFPMDAESVSLALSAAKAGRPGIRGMELCTERAAYLDTADPALADEEARRIGDELCGTALDAIPADPVYKLYLFTRRGTKAPDFPGLRKVYAGETVTEYLRADVSKRSSAAALCEAMQIPPEAVTAYGDSENDRELLTFAGRAVTMYGAKHDLFSLTPYHTQNVAESVLAFLKKDEAEEAERSKNKRYGNLPHL